MMGFAALYSSYDQQPWSSRAGICFAATGSLAMPATHRAEAQAQTKVVADALLRMARRAQKAADGLDKLTKGAKTT